MVGFESYNKLKNNIKDSRQIYDITYHLYQEEKRRLQLELRHNKSLNPTFLSSVRSVEHSPSALYQRLEYLYPYKLRQLILISTITALEVYLTDVILEIFDRDISPFKVNEPITFQKNYLLSLSSISKLHNELIKKDFRNLTSGGLSEIVKYYKKTFDIDLKNLGLNFQDIEEIHIRRHLFVHRNGITDSDYINKFKELGYKAGEQIKIDHDYLIKSLNKITEFAGLINKEILKLFPEINRLPKYYSGSNSFDFGLKNLMIELSILEEKFDYIDYLNKLEVKGKRFMEYVVQITSIDNTCIIFVSGSHFELSSFFNPFIEHKCLNINKIIEIKN